MCPRLSSSAHPFNPAHNSSPSPLLHKHALPVLLALHHRAAPGSSAAASFSASMAMGAVETGHLDMVHDAQLDYYGKRLATCSSDRTVKVFDLAGDQRTLIADLRGHDGPIWQVSWAHPRYGSLLASASFDHRVIIWKEGQEGQWMQVRRRCLLCAQLPCLQEHQTALLQSVGPSQHPAVAPRHHCQRSSLAVALYQQRSQQPTPRSVPLC
jgi:WD40 repeat protein